MQLHVWYLMYRISPQGPHIWNENETTSIEHSNSPLTSASSICMDFRFPCRSKIYFRQNRRLATSSCIWCSYKCNEKHLQWRLLRMLCTFVFRASYFMLNANLCTSRSPNTNPRFRASRSWFGSLRKVSIDSLGLSHMCCRRQNA